MALFSHKRGTVARILSSQGQGSPLAFTINLDLTGISLGNGNARAIITQGAIVQNGNYQFLHTLNQTIYVYVFGDRIGELRVSGLAFAEPCGGGTGMKDIYEAYQANKLSVKGGPVLAKFGDIELKSFLTGMSLENADPETRLGQWAFRFNTFPGA